MRGWTGWGLAFSTLTVVTFLRPRKGWIKICLYIVRKFVWSHINWSFVDQFVGFCLKHWIITLRCLLTVLSAKLQRTPNSVCCWFQGWEPSAATSTVLSPNIRIWWIFRSQNSQFFSHLWMFQLEVLLEVFQVLVGPWFEDESTLRLHSAGTEAIKQTNLGFWFLEPKAIQVWTKTSGSYSETLLQKSWTEPQVLQLQKALFKLGYLQETSCTGIFDADTATWCRCFDLFGVNNWGFCRLVISYIGSILDLSETTKFNLPAVELL